MSGSDSFIMTFDDSRRILHLGIGQRIQISTAAQLESAITALDTVLRRISAEGRIYLIIDMSNLIIEPELSEAYANHARRITETHVLPGGIARYGYQITRVTVRRGYAEYLDDNPNIFSSREEAYDYIYSLIAHQQDGPPATATPVTVAPGEGR